MRKRVLLSALLLTSLVFASRISEATEIDAALYEQMSHVQSDAFLPVVFILNQQADFNVLYNQVKYLPKLKRREQVISQLQTLARNTQKSLATDLRALQSEGLAENIRPLWISNLIATHLKISEIAKITSRHPEVVRVIWDPPRSPDQLNDDLAGNTALDQTDNISWGVSDIGAPLVWNLGYYGQGVLLATIDTGVNYNHPDLADHIWVNPGEDINANGIIDTLDWNGIDDDQNGYVDDLRGWAMDTNTPEVMDPEGHGTATAGIAVGDGTLGTVTGVAPEATLMILKNSTGGQSAYWEAQQYAVMMGANVVTSSMSYKWWFQPKPDYATFRQNTSMELAAGLIHSNSIGNEGDTPYSSPIPFNVATPGNCPPPWLHPDQTLIGGLSSVLGVGAYFSDYYLANYSSLGPSAWNLDDILSLDPLYPFQSSWPPQYYDYPYENTQYQGLLKPDLAAPTVVVTTNYNGGYFEGFWGTSAATPHLGGTLCLLLSANPDATPVELAELVMTTAIDMGEPGKDNLWGCGRLSAITAMAQLLSLSYGSLTGQVTDIHTGQPIYQASVELPEVHVQTQTDTSGWYMLPWIPEGIYDVRFNAYGYDTLWVPDVAFSSGVVETLSVALGGPHIEVIPEQITVSLSEGETTQEIISVSNTGTSPLNCEINKWGDWDLYQIYGTILAQNITGDNELFGVEVVNGSIWISGGNSNSIPQKLYQLSFEGELINIIDQPPSASSQGWYDLTWDGQYIYGSSGSTIEGIDTSGVVQEVIDGPLELHRALAYDPGTDHFYACNSTTQIVEFGRDGIPQRSWEHNLRIQGLAWHPQDDDLCPLYIFSRDGNGIQLRNSKMNPDEGEIIYLCDLIGALGDQAGGAAISGEIDPDRWCFVGLIRRESSSFDRVQIHSLNVYAPWLSVVPSNGSIPPDSLLEAVANLSAALLSPGEYGVNLVVHHNTPQDEVVIPVSLTVSSVGIENTPSTSSISEEFRINPAHPNPFNPLTILSYTLPKASHVDLTVYDVQGRIVAELVSGMREAGYHEVTWNAPNLASGMYFYRIKASDFVSIKKVVLIK